MAVLMGPMPTITEGCAVVSMGENGTNMGIRKMQTSASRMMGVGVPELKTRTRDNDVNDDGDNIGRW